VPVRVPAVAAVGDLVGLHQSEVAQGLQRRPERAALDGAVPGLGVRVEELGQRLAGVVAKREREELDAHALVDG
jgi:hypothetical protein